jgi:short subunit dehydrogenase-like uncharacterized protein
MVPTVIPGTLWLWRRGARAYAPCWLAGVPAQSRRWRKTSVCPRGWFDLADAREAAAALADTAGVAHFAGPFSATSAQMIDACLASQTHYLDITGELDIFLAAQRRHADAQAAGIVICPGVGFDVIPTHCLAAALKEALPDATHLVLAFDARAHMSTGAAGAEAGCAHSAANEHASTFRACDLNKFGLKRRVDHVGDPMMLSDRTRYDRISRNAEHPDRCRIHEPANLGRLRVQILDQTAPLGPAMIHKVSNQHCRASAILVVNENAGGSQI